MSPWWIVCKKELRETFRDRRTMAMMVLGGDPQMAYNAGLLAVLYAGFLSFQKARADFVEYLKNKKDCKIPRCQECGVNYIDSKRNTSKKSGSNPKGSRSILCIRNSSRE